MWKSQVYPCEWGQTNDPIEASKSFQSDDGFSLGILYQAPQPVWQQVNKEKVALAQIEEVFFLR